MSFDVRTEKFNLIKYPDDGSFRSNVQMMIVHYEGRLAIVKKYFNLSIDIWILMDSDDGNEWTHKSFVLPEIVVTRWEDLRFNGVSDAVAW
ncbi:putative F-box protein [Cardamine amara subsp. amara]|uniref:F-box protein n=1 Tax=Cardamine amara subsp. amara TaxID=228776 RepID=A0ABD1C964_CARAN